MSESIWIGVGAAAGVLAGAVYFAGLWWTIKRGLTSANPALWFTASFFGRAAVALACALAVSRHGPLAAIGWTAGFGLVRLLMVGRARNVRTVAKQ